MGHSLRHRPSRSPYRWDAQVTVAFARRRQTNYWFVAARSLFVVSPLDGGGRVGRVVSTPVVGPLDRSP